MCNDDYSHCMCGKPDRLLDDDYYIPYSECCGVDMPDWPDSDLCPSCLEHSQPHDEAKE